jgi:hypothetical protein
MFEHISRLAEKVVTSLSRHAVNQERRSWLRAVFKAGAGLAAVVGFPQLLRAGQQGPCPPMVNTGGVVVCGDTADNPFTAKRNLGTALATFCGTKCVGSCKLSRDTCQPFGWSHGAITITANGASFQACTPVNSCSCVCRPAPSSSRGQ